MTPEFIGGHIYYSPRFPCSARSAHRFAASLINQTDALLNIRLNSIV